MTIIIAKVLLVFVCWACGVTLSYVAPVWDELPLAILVIVALACGLTAAFL